MMQTNYFVCTLGQASRLQSASKSYHTISEFVRYQAQHHTDVPAVGFTISNKGPGDWTERVLTFGNIDQGTDIFAERLSQSLKASEELATVALLCHSSPEFLFTWLGLMRLGHPVLLIAPQCQPPAIAHLCGACEAAVLLHDVEHTERARQSEETAKESGGPALKAQLLPLQNGEDVFEVIQQQPKKQIESPQADELATAYLHHTSGTSSGLPKPIPQSHRAGLGVLPHLPKSPGVASFTTTPLYHGGIADLFRCWTSNALIWLFPSKDLPITARNICKCLEVAGACAVADDRPKVGYFSSVPYVLQMMESDEAGLGWLKRMEIVGVGGAALPAEVGDRLVEKGVNLISRFGSAECGFLLSSYRDFATDNEWQYLRNYNPPGLVDFEKRDDGLAELVIKPGWPHMAKRNREDGSFATADLFAAHPTLQNAWLYHSRADAQLTLITGKKFDPAPLEAAIATSAHLDDVLIFGNNRPFPGALLLRSKDASTLSDQELLAAIGPVVEKLNKDSQDHARIPLEMLVPLPHQEIPLEKSSKGTIIRRAAESRFESAINATYEAQGSDEPVDVSDEDLPEYLTGLIQSITGQSAPLTEDMDLFAYGVDSIACIQLRRRLRRLVPRAEGELPMSVVEDCGSIGRLTDYVLRKRHGKLEDRAEDEETLMFDLVEQYGTFVEAQTPGQTNGQPCEGQGKETVVLTGATGALGAYILDLLQQRPDVEAIYCLVRGADQHAVSERVSKSLQQRGLTNISSQNSPSKVQIIPARLGDADLGLPDHIYAHLATHATHIIHIAWTVNFRLKLRSFVPDNIAGLRHLLDLALAAPHRQPPRFTYCSSTAATLHAPPNPAGALAEHLAEDPSSSSPLGYSRSKWVAEHICGRAHSHTALRGRIAVVRVGQLSGDSVTGVWNAREAWPMMLSTAALTGCLPDLKDEVLDWLPVDVAARAFDELVHGEGDEDAVVQKGQEMPVLHVLNPHREPSWGQMLQWISKKDSFETVTPAQWLARLEKCETSSQHSALKLLGLWKAAYGEGSAGVEREAGQGKERVRFAMEETRKRVAVLRNVKPLDEAYVGRVWEWVKGNVA